MKLVGFSVHDACDFYLLSLETITASSATICAAN